MSDQTIIPVVRKNRTESDSVSVIGQGKKLLPTNYFFDEKKGLFKDGKLVSNFLFYPDKVVRQVKIPEDVDQIVVYVIAIIVAQDDVIIKKDLFDLRHFLYTDWQLELDSRMCLAEDFKESERVIQYLFRNMVSNKEVSSQYLISQLGWFCIEKFHAYNAGNRILGDVHGLDCVSSPDLNNFKLQTTQVDLLNKNERIQTYLREYLQLYTDKSPLIFSYLILGLLRSLFMEAGVPPKFCLFLVGENQSYKTTVASFGCAIYNRCDDVEYHLHNLTGSEAKLMQVLDQEKDMVSIIDDLNRCDSKSVERLQEQKISNLIRVAANNVGRYTMHRQYDINGQVLFCGEYALKNQSTNNRLIAISFEKGDILKEKLSSFQKKYSDLGLFVEDFINWAAEKYDDILHWIYNEYQDFRDSRDKQECYQERLATNYHCLDSAYYIACQYFNNRNIDIPVSAAMFRTMLENNMQSQIEMLEMDGRDQEDYVKEIYVALREHYDELVFEKKPKNRVWRKDIFYNKTKDLICIPANQLTDLERQYSGREVTAYNIISQFDILGLLDKDDNKQKCRTKKVFGKRAYCIKYGLWEDYFRDNYMD